MIYADTTINGYPPVVTDFQRFFSATGATAQSMVARLADLGFVARTPGATRGFEIRIRPESLPVLCRP